MISLSAFVTATFRRRFLRSNTAERGGSSLASAAAAAVELLECRRLLSVSLVENIKTSVGDSEPDIMLEVGGVKIFIATDLEHGQELWQTDGTEAGTKLLVEVNPGTEASVFRPQLLNGKAIFLASGPNSTGRPYVTDGTAAGTLQLAPITNAQGGLVIADTIAYFGTNTQIWRTDGTVAGTFPVANTNSFMLGEEKTSYAVMGDRLYFPGTDEEPWVTDGTVEGTHQFIDVYPTGQSFARYFEVTADNTLYFSAEDGIHGEELWRSDGTPEGTKLLRDITPGSWGSRIHRVNQLGGGRIVFNVGDTLWSTDGTAVGTMQIKGSYLPQSLAEIGGVSYFSEDGYLWLSDGTITGTHKVQGSPTGVVRVLPAGDTVYIAGVDAAGGKELWGARNGIASKIKEIVPGPNGSDPMMEVSIGGRMYFRANDGTGAQLWESDGTDAGTFPITIGGPSRVGLTAFPLFRQTDGKVFLRADDGVVGSELWAAVRDSGGSFSISDVTASEGNSGVTTLTFNVSRTGGTGPASVNWSTANGTTAGSIAHAGSDYTAAYGSVHFASGELSKQVKVSVIGDVNVESNESFFVNLSNGYNATFADSRGVGTIVNDDQLLPGLTINDLSITEGNSGTKNLSFSVKLNKTTSKAVSFGYYTASNTATSAVDYVAKSGTVTIPALGTTAVVTIAIKGDATFEPNETFYVKLNNAHNATIADNSGTGTIVNDEARPLIRIYDAPGVIEGNSGTRQLVFTVKLDRASSAAVTVNFATADGTAKLAANDYKATSGKLTFNPGDTTKTIIITTIGDTRRGVNETVYVNLSSPVGATIADGQAVGTILNDD